MKKNQLKAFLLFCLSTIYSCDLNTEIDNKTEIEENDTIKALVIKVYDGDTITIKTDKKCTTGKKCKKNYIHERIRLYGIDAPEANQEYGQESAERLREIILNQEVEIEVKNIDKYKRIVGKIYYKKYINHLMVEEGMAWAYRHYLEYDTDPEDQKFITLEENARKNKIGLWGTENPINPYEWRKKNKNKKK